MTVFVALQNRLMRRVPKRGIRHKALEAMIKAELEARKGI
jgi:hypothetical protein